LAGARACFFWTVSIIKALEYQGRLRQQVLASESIDRSKNEGQRRKKTSDLALFLLPDTLQLVITGERTGGLEGSLKGYADMAEGISENRPTLLRVLNVIILVMGAV